MQFLQPTVINPLNNRVSLNNCDDLYFGSKDIRKKSAKTLRQSITITNGYFCNDVMRQIEHCNNLDLNKVSIAKPCIGRGTSAVVHLALYNHHYIALKEYKLNDTELNNATLSEFQNELNILKLLNNAHIIEFFGFHLNVHRKVLKFAFEYCRNGSLFDLIHPLFNPSNYEYKDVLNILLNIAKGMKYLHSQNIINRDLKPRNLLIFDDLNVKITDFGESVLIDYDSNNFVDYKLYEKVGTNGYKAPEVISIDQEKGYNYKIDVFSFGSICYELFTKKYTSGIRYLTKFHHLKYNLHLTLLPSECPHHFAQLIVLCWQFKPDTRPDFDVIIDKLHECAFNNDN